METSRIFLYRFLSMAFSYPDTLELKTLKQSLGDLKESIRRLQLDYDAGPLQQIFIRADRDILALQGEHNSLFATALKAPARETAYELDKTSRRAAELADIEGFYKAFGLQLRAPIEPDSLVAELEFLSLLAQKQVYAIREGNQEGMEICREAYHKFLADHLGRWFEAFVQRLDETAESEYYRMMCALLKIFLTYEVQRNGPAVGMNLSATPSPL